MLPEDLHRFKDIIKTLLGTTKGLADAVGVTINALGSASIRTNFGKFKLVILDEGGVVDLAQLLLIVASVDFDNLINFSQSVITYIRSNHWKSASLYLQRRGSSNISVVFSPLFYGGKIKDAPCTSHPDSHPKTLIFLDFFKKLFPEVSSDLPLRYLDVRDRNEIKDNTTGSWMNVDTAAVIVSIVEQGIRSGVFKASDIPHITHYTAQQKIFRHAYAKLAIEFPGQGFESIMDYTTDTFQGDGGPCPFADPVPTEQLCFTNNKGRNCVMQTRGEDFCIVVGNPTNLHTNNMRGVPYLKRAFDIAKKNKCCVTIKLDGPHGSLMNHRYVHPRVI
jgi:hypothetical protein